jgi:hypothetical protein
MLLMLQRVYRMPKRGRYGMAVEDVVTGRLVVERDSRVI